jgi:hypothetical protein
MAAPKREEYIDKRPGFVIKSGSRNYAGEVDDLAIITDNTQGFEYTVDGNKYDRCNATSYETCGWKGQDKVPSKIIRAIKGDIVIEALDGDIVLKGLNVRLVSTDGSGEITLTSLKNVTVKSPIAHIDGTNVNISGKNNLSLGGGSTELFGKMSQSEVKGTDVILEPINAFLSGAIKWLKLFTP